MHARSDDILGRYHITAIEALTPLHILDSTKLARLSESTASPQRFLSRSPTAHSDVDACGEADAGVWWKSSSFCCVHLLPSILNPISVRLSHPNRTLPQ